MDAHDRGRRRPARAAAGCAIFRAGDQVVVGMRGIRVVPESKERDRLAFAFMSNGISSERQVETAVRQTAALMQQTLEQRQKVIVVVAGPVVVHTGGVHGLSALIRGGCVHALLSGNALGVHDVEAALFGTSLGVRLADGRQEEHGHRNHMRAINAIYHCGRRAQGAWRAGRLQSGIMYECVNAQRALRAGRQPARRRPAARHHHRHERGAGRLRRAAEGRRAWCCAWAPCCTPSPPATCCRAGSRSSAWISIRRWPPRSAIAAPARPSAWSPTSACSSTCWLAKASQT